MPARKSLLVDSAMILALILIGVIGYKLSPLLLPKADVFPVSYTHLTLPTILLV